MKLGEWLFEPARKSEGDAISRMDNHMNNATEHFGMLLLATDPSTTWTREIATFLNNSFKEFGNMPSKKPINTKKLKHQEVQNIPEIYRMLKRKGMTSKKNVADVWLEQKIENMVRAAHAAMVKEYNNRDFTFTAGWVMSFV